MKSLLKFLIATFFLSNLIVNISCKSNKSKDDKLFDQYRQVRFEDNQSLERFLQNILKQYRLPGIAAAIVTKDSILNIAIAGIRKSGSPQKIHKDDLFCIGSCTKSMTAALAAILVEENILSWDTRPANIFTELKGKVHEQFQNITLKDLLSHQSGIRPYYSDNFFYIHTQLPFLTGTLKNQRKNFTIWQLQQEPASKPKVYNYSNGGYVVAAAMMEEATGKSWEELIQVRLFKQLNMHSVFIGMPSQKDDDQPWRHYHRAENGNPVPLALSEREIPELFNPAGTVSLTIKDFARYAMFHLRGLAGEDGILLHETIQFLHEPIIEGEDSQFYGLGWGIRWYDKTKVSAHSGSDQTIYAMIGIDHKNLHAGMVLCNMGDQQAEAACANVLVEIMP